MGKPTVSFLRDDRYLADFPGSPVVSANPSQLTDALERLVTDVDLRTELGMQGRRWTEQYWSYSAVGERYRELHQEIWSRNGLGRKVTRRVRRRMARPWLAPAHDVPVVQPGVVAGSRSAGERPHRLLGVSGGSSNGRRGDRRLAVAAAASPRGSYDDLCRATLADRTGRRSDGVVGSIVRSGARRVRRRLRPSACAGSRMSHHGKRCVGHVLPCSRLVRSVEHRPTGGRLGRAGGRLDRSGRRRPAVRRRSEHHDDQPALHAACVRSGLVASHLEPVAPGDVANGRLGGA